jgi:predicted nucleotidyltransferase component of viral defense system
LERFLYRLGESPYAHQFVLKGALMFTVWQGPSARSTRDIDLLGRMENTPEHLVEVMTAVCQVEVSQDDGLHFQADSISAERITEAADYQGVRVLALATLGSARIQVRVDIGFGDALVPGPTEVRLPTILDFPPPLLQGYSRESAIAEKLQAMVFLGEINSRMKDFYDVWLLASHSAFQGPVLADAIRATFTRRHTPLAPTPIALSANFTSADKQAQWTAFISRLSSVAAPARLATVIEDLAAFLLPPLAAVYENDLFDHQWPPGGPWQPGLPPEHSTPVNTDRTT